MLKYEISSFVIHTHPLKCENVNKTLDTVSTAEWLQENWAQMVQSVLTLTNNSIILMSHSTSSTIDSKNDNLIELNDARDYLRKSHGDIYLAVENALESYRKKYSSENESPRPLVTTSSSAPDDGEDEDNFYSPDEDAIDSFITKWKNERLNSSDSEIQQLFQLSLDERRDVKIRKENEDANVKIPPNATHKSDVDSLRNYLIKKYFGSEDALNAASETAAAAAAAADKAEKRSEEQRVGKNSNSREEGKTMQVPAIDRVTKCDTSSASSNNAKSAVVSNDDKSPMNTNEDDDVLRDIAAKSRDESVKTSSESELNDDDDKKKVDQSGKSRETTQGETVASSTRSSDEDASERSHIENKEEEVEEEEETAGSGDDTIEPADRECGHLNGELRNDSQADPGEQ